MLREKLQRNEAVELGVLGFVDNAHSILAQLLEDLVPLCGIPYSGIMRYGLTDHCLPRYWQKYVGILKSARSRARTELSYCDTAGASFLFNSSAQFRTTMICVDAASWSGSLIMRNRWPSVVTS